jgi:hypothetical protein
MLVRKNFRERDLHTSSAIARCQLAKAFRSQRVEQRFWQEFFRHTAFSIARTDEALLRIAPAKLNYEPKNFSAEIGVSPWPGIVAQRSANSNTDSDAKEEVVLSSF